MGKQITIRAPKKILAKWLKALRTGGYKQAKGTLYNPKTCGFCCLGVLQHCVTKGGVEVLSSGEFGGIPTREWLSDNGIEFFGDGYGIDNQPYLPTLQAYAAEANDNGTSFKKLADAIEACSEGY